MLVDEESSSEELFDTSPLRQRRSKRAHDPLHSQQTETTQAFDKENPKAKLDGQESNMDKNDHTQQEQQVFQLNLCLSKLY